jgi:MFS family permease
MKEIKVMTGETDPEQNNTRSLLALLASIYMTGAGLSYEAPLVVKITDYYQVSKSEFGLLLGTSTVVMALASAPWGYWADKYSRLRLILLAEGIIAGSMVLSGICLHLHLPFAVFGAAKIIGALGLAGVGPIATSAIMDTVGLAKRGAAYGWVGVCWALGGGMGMMLPAACMHLKLGLGPTFYLGAVMAAAFMAVLFFVDEPRRGSQDEALKDSVGAGVVEYQHHIRLSDLRVLLSRPANRLLILAMVFFQIPTQALALWFITFLMVNHNLPELSATLLMMIAFIGQPFGNALGGVFTDRAYRWKRAGRPAVMIAAAALAPTLLAGALLMPFYWIPFTLLMVAANFFIVASGPGLTTVSLEVNLPEHRGTISSLMAVCSSLSRAAAWYVTPLAAAAFARPGDRYDYALAFTAAAYVPLVAIYILMGLRMEKDLAQVHGVLEERAKKLTNGSDI